MPKIAITTSRSELINGLGSFLDWLLVYHGLLLSLTQCGASWQAWDLSVKDVEKIRDVLVHHKLPVQIIIDED